MRILYILLLIFLGNAAIKKRQIQIGKKQIHSISAEDVLLSQADLALYQSDTNIENSKSQLKSEITNWVQAKQTLIDSMNSANGWFQLFFTKQQQIGILLVLVICFAFYLMVKSEDRNLKMKKQNIKKKYPELPIQVLTDSVLQQQQCAQISTIIGSIQYEERVNKSMDQPKCDLLKQKLDYYRCNSQPNIFENRKQMGDDYSEEINCLLKDMS